MRPRDTLTRVRRIQEERTKLAVIYRPRSTPPLEAMPMMMEGMAQRLTAYEGKFDSIYFFAGGGGFGLGNFDHPDEIQKMTAEDPFTLFSEVEIRPIVDSQTVLKSLQDAAANRG